MSMAIGHFTFGVGATTGVLMATGLDKKIKNTEPIRIAGGIFAMLPDAGKLIPSFDFLHRGWWADIFWLHQLSDILDSTDSALISSIFIAFMLVMLMIFWSVRKKRDRIR